MMSQESVPYILSENIDDPFSQLSYHPIIIIICENYEHVVT